MPSAPVTDPNSDRTWSMEEGPPGKNAGVVRMRIYEDNFGKLIADGTTNEADLAAHHPFTPERYRLYKNGTRQFPHYDTITGFSDSVDSYDVTGQPGDTWTVKTAEQYNYKVGYVIAPSFAVEASRTLSGDDIVVIGYGDADLNNVTGTDLSTGNGDGWFLKFDGGMDEEEGEFIIMRNGEVKRSKTVTFNRPIDQLRRFAFPLDWYNVGTAVLIETFAKEVSGARDEQLNKFISEIGIDGDRGPETANKNIEVAFRADGSALTVNVGSFALISKGGNLSPINRSKPDGLDSTLSTTGTWVPVYAFRKKDAFSTVATQLADLELTYFEKAEVIDLLAVAVDSTKTDAGESSGWNAPDFQHAYNTAVEVTEDVTQIPDVDGNQEDIASTGDKPGGHTIGHAQITPDKGSAVGGKQVEIEQKRGLNNRDIGVFLVKSSTTGRFVFHYRTNQNF